MKRNIKIAFIAIVAMSLAANYMDAADEVIEQNEILFVNNSGRNVRILSRQEDGTFKTISRVRAVSPISGAGYRKLTFDTNDIEMRNSAGEAGREFSFSLYWSPNINTVEFSGGHGLNIPSYATSKHAKFRTKGLPGATTFENLLD